MRNLISGCSRKYAASVLLVSVLSVFLIRPTAAAVIDIMLVVDATGSYGEEIVSIAGNLSQVIDSGFDPDDDVQIGLVTFGDSASFVADIGPTSAVTTALTDLLPDGSLSPGAQAVSLAATATFRPGSFRHIVVFTDGPGTMTQQEIATAGSDVQGVPAFLWLLWSGNTGEMQNYQDLLVAAGSVDPFGRVVDDPQLFPQVMGELFATDINGISTAPVPVPVSAWLLGSGLLGLIGCARRKVA